MTTYLTTYLTQQSRTGYFYFTITCFNWISLFQITSFYDHIYNWFDLLKGLKILINAYVIMPNHLHGVLYADNLSRDINSIIGTGKRFMSYDIVKRLEHQNEYVLLQKMSEAVAESDRLRGKLHQVFEPSLDIKELTTVKFMAQKINYIHQNPVRGRWRLVSDYRLYKHSSAGFYEPHESAQYEGYDVVHYAGIEEALDNLAQSPSARRL